MTGNRNDNRRPPMQSSGFSLIEILVVLIILLIGIFAILRLFPGGFFTIKNTGELTQAQALAQQNLDSEKQQPQLFEALVAIDPLTGNPIDYLTPDTITDESVTSTPTLDPYYLSNINIFRHVIGETFRVSVPTSNSGQGYGAVYLLRLSPVFNQFGTDASGAPTDSLAVYGTPLERTEQSSVPGFNNQDATPLLRNEGQYAIDYAKLKIAFLPRIGTKKRLFTLSYDYFIKDASNNISVVSVANGPATVITVPDVALNPNGDQPRPVWQQLFKDMNDPNGMTLPSNFDPTLGLKLNSEEVSRKFRLVTANTVVGGSGPPGFSSDDPYEYAWYSEQKSSNANVGVLIFNPTGHNQTVQTTGGPQPLVARVDYTTFDNHIIREDRSVPNSGPYDIRLSLQNIRLNGSIGDNRAIYDTLTVYTGMFRDVNGGTTPDLLIYNANTGEKIGELTGTTSSGPVRIDRLDDRGGIIRLNQADVESLHLQSASLRFFYRTEGEWGTQIQKANSHYTQSASPMVNYKSFYLGRSDGTNGQPNRIYFPLCEAGKTVVLGEYFVKTNQAAPNDKLRFANESYQINAESAQFEMVGGKLLTYVDLSTQHPESDSTKQAWQFDYTQTGRAVSNARGGSLRSRVLWKSAQRWRKVDNDTFLYQNISR